MSTRFLPAAGGCDRLCRQAVWSGQVQRGAAARAGRAPLAAHGEAQQRFPTSARAALLTVLRAQGAAAVTHAQRVADLAAQLARALDVAELEVSLIEIAALLCDVERLDIHGTARKMPHLGEASAIAVAARERCDGTGFPLGLHGAAIPRGARIVAVASAYEELVTTSQRPLTPADAIETLCGARAREFDPAVLHALRAVQPGLQPTAA